MKFNERGEQVFEWTTVPERYETVAQRRYQVGDCVRYVIGNDHPRAVVLAVRHVPSMKEPSYTVRFWYQGRCEELETFACNLRKS